VEGKSGSNYIQQTGRFGGFKRRKKRRGKNGKKGGTLVGRAKVKKKKKKKTEKEFLVSQEGGGRAPYWKKTQKGGGVSGQGGLNGSPKVLLEIRMKTRRDAFNGTEERHEKSYNGFRQKSRTRQGPGGNRFESGCFGVNRWLGGGF